MGALSVWVSILPFTDVFVSIKVMVPKQAVQLQSPKTSVVGLPGHFGRAKLSPVLPRNTPNTIIRTGSSRFMLG